MPVTYKVDHDGQRVTAMAQGDIRIEDMVAFVTDLAENQALGYSQLFDAREASQMLSADEMRRYVPLVARLRNEHGHAKTACIASSDVTFGMARMYATLASDADQGFMVYRTIEEGFAWLGWPRSTSDQAAC